MNFFISAIYYLSKETNKLLVSLYIILIKRFAKVKDNRIVFQGKPDYSDNPRALSDYLVANGYSKKYELFWIVRNKKENNRKHKGVLIHFLRDKNNLGFNSPATIYYFLTAKYIFCSHGFIIPISKKRSEQQYVALWHGCGYKDKRSDMPIRFFDKALVPGPLFVKTKSYFWNTSAEHLLPIGYPRYDWLLHPSENAIKMMRRIRKSGNKVVLWMPTVREMKAKLNNDETISTHFPLLKNDEDWGILDAFCKDNGIIILVKLHQSEKGFGILYSKLNNIRQISNEDFEKNGVPMYEFISLTDALITDYSSIAIDYLLVNKPIAFTLDDYDLYKQVRGFVFDNPKDYMPGHHLYNYEDLLGFIRDVISNNDLYIDARKKVSFQAIYKSENYCKELVSCLGL